MARMNRTMKAAVVREFGKPLTIEEVPVPRPDPGHVLVKIEACGVCHTDLHAAQGDWPVKPNPPFIPGRSEEHTSELQSRLHLVCRLLLEKKKNLPSTHCQLIPELVLSKRMSNRALTRTTIS